MIEVYYSNYFTNALIFKKGIEYKWTDYTEFNTDIRYETKLYVKLFEIVE